MALPLSIWTIAFILLLRSFITCALTCQTFPFQPDPKLDPLYAHAVLPIKFLFVPDFGNSKASIAAQLAVTQAFSCLLPNASTVDARAILLDNGQNAGDVVDIRDLSNSRMAAIGSAYQAIVKNQSICDILINALTVAHAHFDKNFWKLTVKNFVLIRPKGGISADCTDELDIWTMSVGLAPAGIFVHVLTIGTTNHLISIHDNFSNLPSDPRIFMGHVLELSAKNFRTVSPMSKFTLRAFAHVIGLSSRTFSRKFDELSNRLTLVRFDEAAFIEPSNVTRTKLQQIKTMLIRMSALGLMASLGGMVFCCICILSNACCHVFREVHELELMEIHMPDMPVQRQHPRTPQTPGCEAIVPAGRSPSEVRLLSENNDFSPNVDVEDDIRTDQTQLSNSTMRTI